MKAQFCRVGRKRPNSKKIFSLSNLEREYLKFMEEAYNLTQSDRSMSDILYYEASKLKKRILNLQGSNQQNFDLGI